MKVLFVVNPNSGKRNEKYLSRRLSNFALSHEFDYKIFNTQGNGDKQKVSALIKEFQASTVVAVGGDGTINLVASLLIGKNINLGIVPVGSANGLAYDLGIPNNVEKSLNKLVDNSPKPMDAIVINDMYHCFHLGDTGMNARIVRRFEKEGSKGLIGYGKHLLEELFSRNTSFRVNLKIGESAKNIKAEMVVIANAKCFGTGAVINPIGKINDGKFELVVIKPYQWWNLLRLVISFFTGNLHKQQNVKVFSTAHASIKFKKEMDLQIDGELIEGIESLDIGIIPDAIKVFY